MTATAFVAQPPAIHVTVDGDVVEFVGQKPIEKQGFVLVPLRGVFERLGARVAYEASTKTIRAVKGSTEVALTLGSTDALVNGQKRTLALPAFTENGTTLVPLRFVSEALGAQVGWRGASRTVVIATTGVAPTPPTPDPVEVRSFTHDAPRPLRAGEKVVVHLIGTPSAAATFSISGVESARDLPLREESDGNYTGAFTIPPGVQVRNAPLFASLKKAGQSSPLIQSAQPVTIDGIAPQVASLSPASGATAAPARLLIYGTLADAGTGIDTAGLQLLVNGKDVTEQATVTEAFFSYKPAAALPSGKTTVAVVVKDQAGNETKREWSFTLSAAAAPVPTAPVAPTKPTILTPAAGASVGDTATVTGKAAPNATIRYQLSYQGTLLIVSTDGVAAQGEVKADDKGNWSVTGLRLTAPLGVKKLTYTFEAAIVGPGDTLSESAKVTFKK